MRQPKDVSKPHLGALHVLHVAADLPQRAQRHFIAHHRLLVMSISHCTIGRCAAPHPQLSPIAQLELGNGTRDVLLYRIEADTAASGNLAVRHTVPHAVYDAPFGRCQDVGVSRAPARPRLRHRGHATGSRPDFPSPAPTSGVLIEARTHQKRGPDTMAFPTHLAAHGSAAGSTCPPRFAPGSRRSR